MAEVPKSGGTKLTGLLLCKEEGQKAIKIKKWGGDTFRRTPPACEKRSFGDKAAITFGVVSEKRESGKGKKEKRGEGKKKKERSRKRESHCRMQQEGVLSNIASGQGRGDLAPPQSQVLQGAGMGIILRGERKGRGVTWKE